MSTARPSRSPTDDGGSGIDATPLLTDQIFLSRRFVRRPPSLRGAARFLRRASNWRMMREPELRVRDAAAEQIEERQSDWACSRPIVILDLLWNFAFVFVALSVLVVSRKESPTMPLRLWIVGYALQCVLHMVCVSVEYKRRRQQRISPDSLPLRGGSGGWWSRLNSNLSSSSSSSSDSDVGESGDYLPERPQIEDETSVAKHLESANTMFSFIWWIIGFYWVSAGGEALTQDSPQLYWLCITFLAFDVFFVVICVAVACVIGIAVCCCLPCIIAILYAVADQEGATKEDIERLPKYKFRRIGDFEKQNGEIQESFGGIITECDTDSPIEHVLSPENAECCICLCPYEDGTELRELPCRHHFHCTCIDKWLYINATCPLCKFNILKSGNQSSSEEV
ncbi:E3 ubiquitin-protein ligase [Camellia lanceoleosa]|uniref:E3 ubiquitin-protein ligase n=1 Tax=Camellia lanceoleosa TaxID=1840588 RepID=A0ACC0IJ57_9ERIC|nr:E3 ubiquitin-protein ligase [Camellia lanceoleosa]